MSTRMVLAGILLVAVFAASGEALPTTCQDPCTINAATPGFVSPAVSIGSGTNIVWESLDISHPTGEGLVPEDSCFIVSTHRGSPAPPVRFDRTEDGISANGVACSSAVELPTGEAMLIYRCLLHGNMVGTITVT